MFVPCGDSAPNLKGFTLLMPAVSVGNVGQLAIDLIISTLDMCKIGYFYTDCLVPMVGNDPYATAEEDSTELSINAEVYSLPSKKLVALQIRSIFIKFKSKSFCEKLLSWVKNSDFAKVVVLSSSHSSHCDDLQLGGTPFRYLYTPSMQKNVQNKIKSLNWREMESSPRIPEIEDSEPCIRIPGGGITKTLYDESCSKEIPMVILLKFVSEGDNIPDALDLVEYLNEWLHIIKRSVSLSLFRDLGKGMGVEPHKIVLRCFGVTPGIVCGIKHGIGNKHITTTMLSLYTNPVCFTTA